MDVVTQVCIVAYVVQDHVVRVLGTIASGTPEARVVALVAVTYIVERPTASRQRRERKRIRAITVSIPTRGGLENPASCRLEPQPLRAVNPLTTNCCEQSFPFCRIGQVITTGTDSANRVCTPPAKPVITTALAVRAPYTSTIHSRSPCVKATVLSTVT